MSRIAVRWLGACALVWICACGGAGDEDSTSAPSTGRDQKTLLQEDVADLENRGAALQDALVQLDEKRLTLRHRQKSVELLEEDLALQQKTLFERYQSLADQLASLREALDSHALDSRNLNESLGAFKQALDEYDLVIDGLLAQAAELRAIASALASGQPAPRFAPSPFVGPALPEEALERGAIEEEILVPAAARGNQAGAGKWLKALAAMLIVASVTVAVIWILRPRRAVAGSHGAIRSRPSPPPGPQEQAAGHADTEDDPLGDINVQGAPRGAIRLASDSAKRNPPAPPRDAETGHDDRPSDNDNPD